MVPVIVALYYGCYNQDFRNPIDSERGRASSNQRVTRVGMDVEWSSDAIHRRLRSDRPARD